MIVFSESIHVEHDIESEWLEWAKSMLPSLKEDCFSKMVFSKVISHTDETGNTYSLQFYADNKEFSENVYLTLSQNFAKAVFAQFGSKVLFFRTELDVIEVF